MNPSPEVLAMIILSLATWEVLQIAPIKRRLARSYGELKRRGRIVSFVIVPIIGAVLFSAYWFAITRTASALATPVPTTEPQRLPTAAEIATELAQHLPAGARDITDATVTKAEPLRMYFTAEHAALPKNSRGVAAVYELSVGDPGEIGSIGHIFNDENPHPLEWDGPSDAAKCEVTNYSDVPLANVTVPFGVTIRESAGRPNPDVVGGTQRTVGNVIRSGNWSVTISKLLPGDANKAVFYLCNRRDVFVELSLPESVTVEKFGDRKRVTVVLPAGQRAQLPLFPVPPRVK